VDPIDREIGARDRKGSRGHLQTVSSLTTSKTKNSRPGGWELFKVKETGVALGT